MGVVILFSQTQCPTLSHYKRRYHLSQCITCHSFEISTLCSSSLEVDAVCEHAAITCGCLPPSFFPHFTFTSLNSSSPSLSTSQNCSGVSSWSAKCRECRYMTWMLLWQWLKRHVCQQAAHTYSCIVLSRPSLTLFFSSSFVWLGFCLRTIVRPCLFTWLFGHLAQVSFVCFSGWNQFCPPREKYIKLVAKCVFPKGLWCKGKVILDTRRKERCRGVNTNNN